jgi:hypothetical protein
MAAILAVRAIEQSTYVVTVDFTDENGDPVVPNSIAWTLSTEEGAIQNGQADVVVAPAASIEIVLSGDDLEIGDAIATNLVLTVDASYDSTLGTDLPLVGQCCVEVIGLAGGHDVLYGT